MPVPQHGAWQAQKSSVQRILAALTNLGRGLVVLFAIYLFVLNRQAMTHPKGLFYGVLSLGLLFVALPKNQGWRLWALYIVGLIGFDRLKNLANDTGNPIQFHYPVAVEHAMFNGSVSSVWLQQHLHRPNQFQWFEYGLVAVYISFFVVPHLMAIVFARMDIKLFRSYVIGLLATWYLGLIGYFLVPTAPPWLTSIKGYMPPINHLVPEIIDHVSSHSYQAGYTVIGPNDVAAMPSLHTAITCIVALALWRRGWVTGVIGTIYLLAMAFALLYLGEHYIVDEVAGVMIGLFSWRFVVPRVERVLERQPLSGVWPLRLARDRRS